MQLHRPASGRRCIRYSTRWRYLLFSEDHPIRNRYATGPQPVMPRSDTFPRKSVSTTKDPTPIPVPIANQNREHDQGATEHFVRRFARAAPGAGPRLCDAAARDQSRERQHSRPLRLVARAFAISMQRSTIVVPETAVATGTLQFAASCHRKLCAEPAAPPVLFS